MKNLSRFFLALWLIAAGGMGSPATCLGDDHVTIRTDSQVRTGVVRLSDLFTHVPQDTDRDIALAPPSGRPAIYGSVVLTKLAERYGLDWRAQSPTDHVTVSSTMTRIGEDTIRKAIAEKVKETGARGDIDISFDNKTIDVSLPADQAPDFTLNNFDYDPLTKRFRTELTTQNGSNPVAIPLAGRVLIKQRVPVFAHRLEAGSVIAASDIDMIDVPDDRVNESVVTETSQLVGRELRHNTMEGEMLHTNDVMPPRLVTRGGLVTLKIQSAFMTLTAQGKSLQDGTRGETVRILNTQSNRMIEGI